MTVTDSIQAVAPTPRERPGRRRGRLLLRHEAGRLLRVAGPVILAQLGGIGMNTLDTIMVGPLGAEALASAGLGTSLHAVMLMVSTGTLMGMAPLVSQAWGAGDPQRCRRVLVQGLWLALALSVPLFVLNLLGEPMARGLDQPPAVSELTGRYMASLSWGVPPLLVFMALRQYLEGMGRTQPAMVITFLGLGMNYLANRALIHGVDPWVDAHGVVGSGMATSLVRWAMLVAMVAYVLAHRELRPFHGVRLAPEGGLLRRMVAIGAPTGAQVGLEVGLFSFAAVMMGWFGAVELGTHQITINIAATTFMVALGVSIAGSIRVGQHVGARSPSGARRAVRVTYVLALGFMGGCALLFLAVPEALLRLYTSEPAMLAMGRDLLFMAALFQIFDGAQAAGFSVLRGVADTRVPMVLAALAYWAIGAPAAYLLGFHSPMGPSGVWLGLCIGLAAAALLLFVRVRRVLF